MKRIQFILNVIAGVAIFGYAVWLTVIWWQNPEWSQMLLFQHTWKGLVVMVVLVLPSIVYDVYRRWND